MATAAAPEQAAAAAGVRTFKAECKGCGKLVRRRSRKALTWRCPHCGRTNPGPGMLEELAKPGEAESGRRRRRRAAATGSGGSPAQPSSAPAPVRRRVTRAQGDAGSTAPATDAPAQGSPPPPGNRRGLFDRLMYGDDDG